MTMREDRPGPTEQRRRGDDQREEWPLPPMPPVKEHPPELVVCAWCGVLIEDGWFPYHPCAEREAAMRERR